MMGHLVRKHTKMCYLSSVCTKRCQTSRDNMSFNTCWILQVRATYVFFSVKYITDAQNISVPVLQCRRCSCQPEDAASSSEMFLLGLGCKVFLDPKM